VLSVYYQEVKDIRRQHEEVNSVSVGRRSCLEVGPFVYIFSRTGPKQWNTRKAWGDARIRWRLLRRLGSPARSLLIGAVTAALEVVAETLLDPCTFRPNSSRISVFQLLSQPASHQSTGAGFRYSNNTHSLHHTLTLLNFASSLRLSSCIVRLTKLPSSSRP